MDKKPLYISLFCLMVIFSGCGRNKEDRSDSQQGSKIVTGKIAPSPLLATEKKDDSPVVLPDAERAGVQEDRQALEPVTTVEHAESEDTQIAAAPDNISPVVEEKTAVHFDGNIALLEKKPFKPSYDPVGKVDPFKPLFTEPAADTSGAMTKRKKRKPLTPLELVDISQLKLVGIVRSADKDRALVEEINGKGYIIKEGTYIGTNSGKVVQILRDRVIVEEEIENVLGNISLKKRELKLQKPLGEE
ncbi:MAG: pilus assembly protein PilP [Proteobacteria bacterium]|nr:pilus assembly protein PilP [Pseudomonadota bacterium]